MGRRAIPTPDSGRPSKIDGFFGVASHTLIFRLFLPIFGSKNFFHPEYGLWGLKSKEIARAFTSCDKIAGFLLETPFSYFLGTFWHFLAISLNFGPRLVYDSSKWSEWVGRSFSAIKFAFLWLCQTLARIWLKFDTVKKTQIRLNVVNALLFPTVLSYHTLF